MMVLLGLLFVAISDLLHVILCRLLQVKICGALCHALLGDLNARADIWAHSSAALNDNGTSCVDWVNY